MFRQDAFWDFFSLAFRPFPDVNPFTWADHVISNRKGPKRISLSDGWIVMVGCSRLVFFGCGGDQRRLFFKLHFPCRALQFSTLLMWPRQFLSRLPFLFWTNSSTLATNGHCNFEDTWTTHAKQLVTEFIKDVNINSFFGLFGAVIASERVSHLEPISKCNDGAKGHSKLQANQTLNAPFPYQSLLRLGFELSDEKLCH